ncbi:hypothetical protein [Streptomyces sp. NPDC052012]|uniref:hypothetical protein n=1 Tax=Streptomyces sp. NPDC052012 TaxID=3155051 RepID=UPI00344E1CB4
MVSKTDNDLAPMIYRYYCVLQNRVAGSEEDLDRRFDDIINRVERRKRKNSRSKYAKKFCASRMRGVVQNVRRSALGQVSASGACAALVAKLTQYAQGWANLAATVATGTLTAIAVVAVMDTRSLKRSGRTRRRREDATPPPHP